MLKNAKKMLNFSIEIFRAPAKIPDSFRFKTIVQKKTITFQRKLSGIDKTCIGVKIPDSFRVKLVLYQNDYYDLG